MLKFVCESCGFAFEVKKANVAKCFNPDCSACGSSDTTEIGRVACELAEYEASQENKNENES